VKQRKRVKKKLRFQLLGIPMKQREETEPPPSPQAPNLQAPNLQAPNLQAPNLQAPSQAPWFRVGRDSHGNWVVQDPRGIRGGLFVDRDQALRFVRGENGNRPQEFVVVGGVLELDMSKASATTYPGQGRAERRAA
jgi:hypothetical protein